jgi:DNA repair protein RadC
MTTPLKAAPAVEPEPAKPGTNVGIRERARLTGVLPLSDVELLALLLDTGVTGLSVVCVAQDLLNDLGGIERLGRVGPHRLAAQRGIGPVKAVRLLAALELGRRVTLRAQSEERQILASFEAVAAWARPRLCTLDHEELWLLSLDARNGLRSARRVAQGGLHGCALSPADVLRPALQDAASAIVLVHNHPSGDPNPSGADIEMTRALARACQVLGLLFLDHVIVARDGAESLREHAAFDDDGD